jgi:hypothetical protein
LKIPKPKGQSEAVNRRIGNALANNKKDKKYKSLHRKLKIEQHEPTKTGAVIAPHVAPIV